MVLSVLCRHFVALGYEKKVQTNLVDTTSQIIKGSKLTQMISTFPELNSGTWLQCTKTSLWISVLTYSKGVQKHKPWTSGFSQLKYMVSMHMFQNVPWLATSTKYCFSCCVLRKAHLELFICFYGDSAFAFSHFFLTVRFKILVLVSCRCICSFLSN